MAVYECHVNDPDSALDTPPFRIDFETEPAAGDFVYRVDGQDEKMYVIQGRFWRKTVKPVQSAILKQEVNKAVHAMFLGVKLIAVNNNPVREPGHA